MGGIVNPVLNKIGNNIFWKRTDYILSNKEKFIEHHSLFDKIEYMIKAFYAINNFMFVSGQFRSFFLKLANSRAAFEAYIDARRTVELGNFAPVPYRKYYKIFSEFLFSKPGFIKYKPRVKIKRPKKRRRKRLSRKAFRRALRRERRKRCARKRMIRRYRKAEFNGDFIPSYLPQESRIQTIYFNVIGFRQNILNVDVELLCFPMLIAHSYIKETVDPREKFISDRREERAKHKKKLGSMKSFCKSSTRVWIYRFHRKLVRKAALMYYRKNSYFRRLRFRLPNRKPFACVRGFRYHRKRVRRRYRKFRRQGRPTYQSRRMYNEFVKFIIQRQRRLKRKFIRRIVRLKRRIKWLVRLKKIAFTHTLHSNFIRRFSKSSCLNGFRKVKINLNTHDDAYYSNAQVSAEYTSAKLRKGYGLQQIVGYTKRCLSFSRSIGKINGYRFCFAGRFTKRQIATYRWERHGRTGINTKFEQIDYGQGIRIGKYGMYILRIWLNLSNMDKRRFTGRI